MIDYSTILELPAGQYEKCMKWAFGPEWNTIKLIDTREIWNRLHSDIFVIEITDNAEKTLKKIGKEYKKRVLKNE